ncbi:MAG: peptidoglycan-binding protein, partial [Actinobacteria bacterium]|nr:peptidoglycan-binding protein [Actinomycetota bacterium]
MTASLALATACVGATDATVGDERIRVRPGSELASNGDPALSTSLEPAPPTAVTTTTTVITDDTPSDERTLVQNTVITDGPLTPKSIEVSAGGLFFANNMMYSHTVTVYDRSFSLVKVIDDSVDLAAYGLRDSPAIVKGSPVEMAFSNDGTRAYVSNYEMSGPGYSNPGNDKCTKGGWDDSFLYRIDTTT